MTTFQNGHYLLVFSDDMWGNYGYYPTSYEFDATTLEELVNHVATILINKSENSTYPYDNDNINYLLGITVTGKISHQMIVDILLLQPNITTFLTGQDWSCGSILLTTEFIRS